jgi:hypothetical protein
MAAAAQRHRRSHSEEEAQEVHCRSELGGFDKRLLHCCLNGLSQIENNKAIDDDLGDMRN